MSRPWPARGVGRPPSSVEEVLDLVRAQGGRATASRRVLLEVLFEAADHCTAEDLADAVQARAPDVHLSTIYRNLDDLQRLGVIAHTHLGHGPATYQLATTAHAHLICEDCGATVEAPEELFHGLARVARARHGFVIDPHHFAILGRCATCTARAAAGEGPGAQVAASGGSGPPGGSGSRR